MADVRRNQAECDAYILVAGDDSLFGHRDARGNLTFFEADASMADQSESSGPLEAEYKVLLRLGMSEEAVDILRTVASATYSVRSRAGWKLKIERGERPTRDTGGADTSIGNSIVFALAWMAVIDAEMDMAVFEGLGLKMKLRSFTDPTQVTFLKGKWYRVVSERFDLWWGPLPSRVLKMGKSLKDPRTLYKGVARRDLYAAYEAFANDVALSYQPFLQVPLIRAFVKRYAKGPMVRDLAAAEPWKATSAVREGLVALEELPELENPYGELEARYGLLPNEVDEMEEQLLSSKPGMYLQHPGYAKLAAVDYQ
jgi:hypothetical protein